MSLDTDIEQTGRQTGSMSTIRSGARGPRVRRPAVRRPSPAIRLDPDDVHRPRCPANCQQVLRIEDRLVTQELGPRPVRRIREIVCQLARRVPSPRGLRRVFPKERETGVGVTKGDHVTGDGPSAVASSRTCRGPSSSGPQITVQQVRGRIPVEQLARTVEPTADSNIVVRTRQITHDEGQEVETGGDRIGCLPSAGEIATGA